MGCTWGMFWHFTGEGCFEVWFLLSSFKKIYAPCALGYVVASN
jgi:hypothetical protein